jgi:signal transduction histidine kinase
MTIARGKEPQESPAVPYDDNAPARPPRAAGFLLWRVRAELVWRLEILGCQQSANHMEPDFRELGGRVAQARVLLSLLALSSLYVDPTLGGLFHLDTWLLGVLLSHLLYSVLTYLVLAYRVAHDPVRKISIGLDLIFATVIAFLTEGRTSPSFIFFVFAIVAAGFRTGFRDTLLVTLCCVTSYAVVVEISDGLSSAYLMRAVYLAIAGYLIGFFGQQRVLFERRLRELETEAQREAIARGLHDGYMQALAAISLRLESCRDMLISNESASALAEIKEIQLGVSREYDEVREYVRPLASAERPESRISRMDLNTQFHVLAAFTATGEVVEHVMQIVLEGIRNTRRHGQARSGSINVQQLSGTISITIDDDGIGFREPVTPPWTIASRVAEFGGRLVVNSESVGAHLEISLPTARA